LASTWTSVMFRDLGIAISKDQMSLPRSFSNSELLIEPPETLASAVFCALASVTLACALSLVGDSSAAARVEAEHAANSPRVSNERVKSLVFMTYLTLGAANLFGPHFAH